MKMTRRLIASALLAVMAGALAAQGAEGDPPFEIVQPAGDTPLDAWLWIKRPVVVFADSPVDPRFIEQMTLLGERLEALDERDVIVITDTDPAAKSPVRQKLRPRGFSLVLIAKDGTIVARKPSPWSVREISRSIDKLPLRQQELKLQTQN